MSKLSDIKQRATRIVNKKTSDQEDARIERAKQEARAEAKRERTQQRVEQARESERERVLNDDPSGGIVSQIADTVETASAAVDEDGSRGVDDVREAFGTDFDSDGETLAEEFGLQSDARAERENATFDQLGGRLDSLEDELSGGQPPGGRGGRGGPPAGGLGGGGVPPTGGLGGGTEFEPIDPEDFGFGGEGDDFFGGGPG